jgi:hypothetical protein
MARVFAHLPHHGDESAAARDLGAAVRGESSASRAARALPLPVSPRSTAVASTDSGESSAPIPLQRDEALPPFAVDVFPEVKPSISRLRNRG